MKKTNVLLLTAILVLPIWGCVVSDAEYKNIVSKNEALEKELNEARDENRLLNDSILEIYRERERLLARIAELEGKVKRSAEGNKTDGKGNLLIYEVKVGDTLSKIAIATGTSLEVLRKLNSMRDDVVWVGQKLRLKKVEGN
ncbi:MAG: LysM peptidoglycan-binding domain-containing protein [Pseudomonadota bacterium]